MDPDFKELLQLFNANHVDNQILNGCLNEALVAKQGEGGCNIAMNYQDILTLEPGKRSGKPCLRGTRITVYDVLSYLAAGE